MPSQGLTESIPKTLVEGLRAGRATLVAGLGCAALAGLPGWPETLRRMAARLGGQDGKRSRRLVEDLLGRGRCSAALAYLRARVPSPSLAEALREAFPPGLPVPEPLALVAALPWASVLLTGFDDLWDRALAAAPRAYTNVEGALDGRGPGLRRGYLHLLGSPDRPEALSLATADLRRGPRAALLTPLVREAFRDRPWVFVGFEPDDPDLTLLTHGLLGGAPSSVEHYFLWAGAPSTPGVVELARAELDLTPVPSGADLDELLRALADAYRPFAAELPPVAEAGPGAWPDLVDATLRQIDDSAAPGHKGEIYGEVARILEERLDDAGGDDPASGEGGGDERPETFEALSRLFRALEDWRACVAALDKWALALREGSRAAEAYLRAGEILGQRLEDHAAAEARYRRALAVDPENRSALIALGGLALRRGDDAEAVRLFLQAERGNARRALHACEQQARGLDGPAVARATARLSQAAGDFAEAIRRYEEALRAGEAPADARHQLGLCQAALGDAGAAATSFALAAAAGHRPAREAVAEGLLAGGDHLGWDRQTRALDEDRAAPEGSVAWHQQLLAREPDRLSSYRTLAELYRRDGADDELACLVATLCFLRKASPEQQVFHRAHRIAVGVPLAEARAPADGAALWRQARHPALCSALAEMLEILGPALAAVVAEPPGTLKLVPDDTSAGRALAAACRALGVPVPLLSLGAGPAVQMVRTETVRPALLLRGPLPEDEVERAFVLARAAALLRPELSPRALAVPGLAPGTGNALGAMVGAALIIAGVTRSRSPEASRLAERLQGHLPPAAAAALAEAARRVIAERGEAPAVLGWMAAADLTAARMALVLTADLGAAARALGADPPEASPLPTKLRLRDLVAFSAGEAHFALRRGLALTSRSSPA